MYSLFIFLPMLAFIFAWCALCYRLFSGSWSGWLPVTVGCATLTTIICSLLLVGFYLTR